ncbi:MAG: hypothetical protein AB7S77_07610 [Desulfatirhabdiaceae bacterium]
MNIKRLGERLSLDHHNQSIIFVLGIIFAVLKVWWSIPGLLLYSVMHFQYGGAGTFQNPPRGDLAHQTVVDFIYVGIGLIGIVTIVCGIVIRLYSVVM